MSIEYVKPADAYEAAGKRLRNRDLQGKISRYLGNLWPKGFEEVDNPLAIFAPYLAKASETEVSFLKLASDSGFTPVVATYFNTDYTTTNPGVVDCYRAPLILPKGQRSRSWIVPEQARSGVVGEAPTIYEGLDILQYWEGIRDVVLEEQMLTQQMRTVDFSEWYRLQAIRCGWKVGLPKSPFYYIASMAMYASGRAVLFDVPEAEFDNRIIVPAVKNAETKFDVSPLLLNEFAPTKRDWTDLSFLSADDVVRLQSTGRIRS